MWPVARPSGATGDGAGWGEAGMATRALRRGQGGPLASFGMKDRRVACLALCTFSLRQEELEELRDAPTSTECDLSERRHSPGPVS